MATPFAPSENSDCVNGQSQAGWEFSFTLTGVTENWEGSFNYGIGAACQSSYSQCNGSNACYPFSDAVAWGYGPGEYAATRASGDYSGGTAVYFLSGDENNDDLGPEYCNGSQCSYDGWSAGDGGPGGNETVTFNCTNGSYTYGPG